MWFSRNSGWLWCWWKRCHKQCSQRQRDVCSLAVSTHLLTTLPPVCSTLLGDKSSAKVTHLSDRNVRRRDNDLLTVWSDFDHWRSAQWVISCLPGPVLQLFYNTTFSDKSDESPRLKVYRICYNLFLPSLTLLISLRVKSSFYLFIYLIF